MSTPMRYTHVYILPLQEDSPSVTELSLKGSEYDEILNRILRVCDYHRPSWGGGVGSINAASHNCDGSELTKYAPLVADLGLSELTRKVRPFGKSSHESATRACYRSWIDAELKCKETNLLIMGGELPLRTKLIIRRARRLITRVLGRLDFDEILSESVPGPGSTFGTTANRTGQYYKYLDEENFTVTSEAEKFLPGLIVEDDLWMRALGRTGRTSHDEYLEWASRKVSTILGNRLITVPKTSSTDRAICIEPGLNLMLQKGVGTAIRRRLRRQGVNLDYQHELHGKLVLQCYSEIGTIDLSAASDTISLELVRALLPCNWFLLLDDIRSKQTLLPGGSWYVNQKFSSMGNGFTFELESLIFWAIATATVSLYQRRGLSRLGHVLGRVHRHLKVSVYGDDIICASEDFECISDMLQTLGFTVNSRKSFSGERAFKESCGVFSFFGRQVPIFNLKKLDTWLDVYVLVNSISKCRRIAFENGWDRYAWALDGIWEDIHSIIPSELRQYGPPTQIMDGYIHKEGYSTRLSVSTLRKLRRKPLPTGTLFSGSYGVSPYIQLSREDRFVSFISFFWSVKTDPKGDCDYFGQSVYSLKNARFQGATRRGYTALHRKRVILADWEVI